METWKELMVQRIEARSRHEAEHLAGEFARAAERDREDLLAALEGEKWLAESCAEALDPR